MALHTNIIGTGQPIIVLHGFLGMGDNWKSLGKKFSEQGYEVHLVDQRNHGRSFHHNEFNYEVLSQDVLDYYNKMNLEQTVLLGHSMGGKTAMHFSSLFPNLVSKLVVADISPRFYPIHHDTILEGLSSLDFSIINSRKAAEEQLALYVPEFGIRQFLLKNVYWEEKGRLALRINLDVLKSNVAEVGEALPEHFKFEGESLFLKGDKSEYISPSDEAIIKRQFSNASLATVSNAGHWLHAENPTEFYDEVIRFISS